MSKKTIDRAEPCRLPARVQEEIRRAFRVQSAGPRMYEIFSAVESHLENIGWDHDPMYGRMFKIQRENHHMLLMRIGYLLKETETDETRFMTMLSKLIETFKL